MKNTSKNGFTGRWSGNCRRVAAGLFAAMVAVLNCENAAAEFPGQDPGCDFAAAQSAAPKFEAPYFKGLTKVWASSEGQTGVFFLQGPSGAGDTLVFKFELQRNVGAVVSRRLLESLKVPSDTLVAELSDAKKIKTVFDGITTASARPNVVDPGRQKKLTDLLAKLQARFDPKSKSYGPPKQIIVTRFLTAIESASSFGAALQPGSSADYATADLKARKVRQYLGALKTLQSPHNQRFLGYLYLIDILMGNNDRFLRTPANWNNIFMAVGANNAACLVAIDNEAHAPLASYLAMAKYVSASSDFVPTKIDAKTKKPFLLKDFGPGGIRFQTAADNQADGVAVTFHDDGLTKKYIVETAKAYEAANQTVADESHLKPGFDDVNKLLYKGDKQSITGDQYLNALMSKYDDKMAGLNPVFPGPKHALLGEHIDDRFIKGWDALKTGPSRDTCEQISEIPVPGSLPIWLRRHLRNELAFMISAMFQGKIAEAVAGGNSVLALSETNVDGNFVPVNKFSDSLRVCKTEMTVSGGAEVVAGKSIVIDWKAFDENFQSGFNKALQDISDMDTMTPVLEAAVSKMPNLKTTDVHASALVARAQFIADLASGMAMDNIIPGMLVKQKSKTYTKDAVFPAGNFQFTQGSQGDFLWVPQ